MYELIQIRGDDAEQFLQGQLTQDLAGLKAAISLPAAWCNPKGRVMTLVRLLAMRDCIGLAIPTSLADAVVQRLAMYRLRSDVDIERTDGDWTCLALGDQIALERLDGAGLLPEADAVASNGPLIAVDFSAAGRFVEVFGFTGDFESAGLSISQSLSAAQHAGMKIRAGLAEITSENTEKYTPHMLNLDRTGAVSFNKGCYTGQEVVARTENLGQSKRRLMRYECDAPGINVGDKLADDERDIGTVVNVSGRDLLAVTPAAIHRRPLTLNGAAAIPAGADS